MILTLIGEIIGMGVAACAFGVFMVTLCIVVDIWQRSLAAEVGKK